ncbi:MAG: hypothetical protein HQL21_02330 [Candidatus Omnitrophica bacterium]|nr:hypothetical protein [Candidatus Omnitrophota bacterium]
MKTIILCLSFAIFPVVTAFSQPSQDKDLPTINIRETTSAQMYRYGRELYRTGNYKGAAQVFKKILDIDCQNKLAQYHLQKIATQGPKFKDIAEFLEKLPCPAYNFSNEDFLPSSLYYEPDADLVLEQLALYNKRFRTTKTELTSQISRYKNMITQLEKKTATLASSLDAAQKNAADIPLWKERLKESQALSERLNLEAAQLKAQLHTVKTAYDKEYKALQAQIIAAKKSPKQRDTQQALVNKEREITHRLNELSTLEEKFAAVQAHLRQIEESLTSENNQIKGITADLKTIKK